MSESLGVSVFGMGLKSHSKLPAKVRIKWFGGGVVAEGGASGSDIWRELGFVEGFLLRRNVLFGDDVVDRLLHLLLFFIGTK